MPIDEAVLHDKIQEFSAKADDCQVKYQDFMKIVSNLRSIEQVLENDIKVDPKDRGTGKKINPARRQEVYDESVALGDTLPQ